MRKLLASVAAVWLVGSAAYGQGVPTVDVKNTLQTIKQLEVMLDDLGIQKDLVSKAIAELEKLDAQLDKLNAIEASLTGSRDIMGMSMGSGLDAPLSGSFTSVIGAFSGAASGDFSSLSADKSGAMTESVNSVLGDAGFEQSDITEMAASGVPGAERTAAQAAGGAVVAATAQQTYEETGVALQRVELLVDMSKDSTDMKMSIDLNTRMLAELAVLMAKNLEMTSVASAYAGQSGVMDAAAIAQERAYMTFSNE